MEYWKRIILLLTIFLFNIASACDSDVNDSGVASEDTSPIEVVQRMSKCK
ncbi:hypothetical protein [uncultured Methanobrevibacter sp.]|nr:hypothetical protein [uncultured Methanobrevibacter sp.]